MSEEADCYCQFCEQGKFHEHQLSALPCGCSADEHCRACGGDDALLTAFDAAMGPLR